MPIPATTPATNPSKSDVLHSTEQAHLTAEEIAKAVARHQREHPHQVRQAAKTAPRG